MCSYFISSRLNKINEQLLTVVQLQKMGNLLNADSEQSPPFKEDTDCYHQDDISKSHNTSQTIINNERDQLNHSKESQIFSKSTVRKKGIGSYKMIANLKRHLREEKERNEELQLNLSTLEKELANLKKEEQVQADQLKKALEKYEEQTKLLEKANNFSNDLIKQSELLKSSRDDLLNQISRFRKEINDLVQKCNNLKADSENWRSKAEIEEKRHIELDAEVKKLETIVKNNIKENNRLEEKVNQLMELINIHKKREAEFITVCSAHQVVSQQKDANFIEKEQELFNTSNKLKQLIEDYEILKSENDRLKICLEDKTKTNTNLQSEIAKYKDTLYCELKVKDKIIMDKNDTINKQKQLLRNSELMARQAAEEFKQLQEQLQIEKENNDYITAEFNMVKKSLIMNDNLKQCRCISERKQKTFSDTKCTVDKFQQHEQKFETNMDVNKMNKLKLNSFIEMKDEINYLNGNHFHYNKEWL